MKTVLFGLTGAVFCGVLVGVLNPVKLGAEDLRFTSMHLAPSPLLFETGASQQQGEEVHAARVDMPNVIDLSHASPDTWDNLPPPVNPYEQLRAPAPPPDGSDIPDSMFGTTSLAASSPQ